MKMGTYRAAGFQGMVVVLLILIQGLAQGDPVQLRINEVGASNDQVIADPQGEYDDWIEIYNDSNMPVDMAGMYLSDNLRNPYKWSFPAHQEALTLIEPKGYLLIWADGDVGDAGLHADFKLDASGEEVSLFAQDGVQMLDHLVFGAQATDVSYGRFPDGSDTLGYAAPPTPGRANQEALPGWVSDLAMSREGGFYDYLFQLTITCDAEGADIYYTTDGSEPIKDRMPSATSKHYTQPIWIYATTCLRAAAIKSGWLPSHTQTETYIFFASEAMKSVPVVSIVGDRTQSLFEPNGIMAIVGGTYNNGVWTAGDDPTAYNNPIHRGIDYERPVSVEIIDAQSGTHVQRNVGIRVAGSDYHRPRYTRGDNWDYNYDKFSFKLFFRQRYGDDELDAPFFPLADTDDVKAIVLRGGHNDVHNPFIKDELLRRLHRDMGGVAVTGTIVNVFINGKYKSFYNPCVRLDHDFFRAYYDVDTDWDVITQRGVRNGDDVAWNAALGFCRSHDLSQPAYYEQACRLIDVEDFIDYLIIELYSGNWDWPNNNWTVSRERSPQGKFRFHCWDMEGTLETNDLNSFGFDDFPSWGPGGLNGLESPMAWLYRAFKANADFRLLFADRIQKHFFNNGALTQDHIAARFVELQQQMAQILPGMQTSILTQWIPKRQSLMLDKFKAEGLFPGPGPVFQVNGAHQHGGSIGRN